MVRPRKDAIIHHPAKNVNEKHCVSLVVYVLLCSDTVVLLCILYQAIFTQPIYNTNGLLNGENTHYGTKQFVALSK